MAYRHAHRAEDAALRRAFHLKSGRADEVALVDRWLAREGLKVETRPDPLSACVYLVSNPEPPELAFFNIGYFQATDFSLVTYAREVWPAVAMVLYGPLAQANPLSLPTEALVCVAPSSLKRLLEGSTEQVIEAARTSRGSSGSGSSGGAPFPAAAAPEIADSARVRWADSLHQQPAEVAELGLALDRPPTMHTFGIEEDDSDVVERPARQAAAPAPGAFVERPVLTPEELDALLGKDRDPA